MGHSIGAAHDPSVAVRRRHLPALRAGRNMILLTRERNVSVER